jgi:tetratricopeptide (TPR) repeat protein
MKRVHIAALCGCAVWMGAVHAVAAQTDAKPPVSLTKPTNLTLDDALHLYRTGKFDAAVQEYQALESSPGAALAYAGLARTYLKLKNPAEAYTAVNKAVEIAPTLADAQVALGEVYFRQGKMYEAEKIFVTVINSHAQNARAFLGLARVSMAGALFAREKKMIDIAHQMDPADPDIQRMWVGTLTLEERIKALHDYLEQETNDDPEERTALEREMVLLRDQADSPAHSCRMVSKVSSTQMPLRMLLIDPNHLRGYGLDVKLNGVTSHLMLDTGAGGILVDRKVGEKAGIKQLVESQIRGIGDRGPAAAHVGQVDTIQIGDLEFHDCRVEVIEQNSAVGEEGLIGANVFANFLVGIDLPDGKFSLSPLPPRPDEAAPQIGLESGVNTGRSASPGTNANPNARFHDRYIAPEMQSYTRIYRFGHMLLIPTELDQVSWKLFLIDTGSLTNLISTDAAREVTHVSGDAYSHVKGLNGEVKDVFRGNELTLTFGTFRQKNLGIIATDTLKKESDAIGTELSGVLGFTVLRMLDLKIDYRDNLVGMTYDARRWR